MGFARLHTLVAYVLAGMGLFALTLGDELSGAASAAIFVGYALSPFVRQKHYGPRYTQLWNGVIVAVLLLQVLRAFGGASILSLGIEFAAALQIAKLFHRVEARDYQHILALAMLHLVAATVLTTGFEYALAFITFVIVLPWMFALTHLRDVIEKHYGSEAEGAQAARAKEVLRSRKIAGPRFLAWTAALSVPLFVATAAFFALFPRVGMGFLSFGGSNGRNVAGFGADVRLGGFGRIRDDATVVMRVRPGDSGRRSFRLRGTSFDRYEDARWSRTSSPPRRVREDGTGYYALANVRVPVESERLDIVLESLEEQVFFLPTGTLGLDVPPRVRGGIDVYRQLDLTRGFDVRYRESDGLEVRYSAVVDPNVDYTPEPFDEDSRPIYLQLPGGMERIARLARDIAGEGSDAQKAERIQAWLRGESFSYSLTMPDTRGRDPLEVFLFEARRGHCEYFSSALAVMLRTLGIPSRNVTGFVGGVFNRYGEYWAIRQGDAHSWVEAYVDGAWRIYDPTPSAHRLAAPEEGAFSDLRAFVDAMRMRWTRNIVGYDLRDQVDGLRTVLRWFRSRQNRDESAAAESEPVDRRPWLAAAALLTLAFLWRRRRQRSHLAAPAKAALIVDLYGLLEARLARRGVGRPAHRTPREHVDALREGDDEDAALAEEVTAAYEAARFGGSALSVERERTLRKAIAQRS
ncbi:MAG: DUF3488 and transglutaminase-like domain-containing protein [Myxococcota bacterium]